MSTLCDLFGYSRQAYYQHNEVEDFEEEATKELCLKYINEIRTKAPRTGCIKLYHKCKSAIHTLDMGRDAFIIFLSDNKLMLRIRRRKTKTTDSNHGFRLYPNLIKEFTPNAPNQLWVSDITYIPTAKGFCYLSLITDAYSRRIVGCKLAPNLTAIYSELALQEALEAAEEANESIDGLIHHSDRGSQYASISYTNILKNRNIQISMTEKGDPLENAIAERVNGILKQEWLNFYEFENFEEVVPILEHAINYYNAERLHSSINMMTPNQAHQLTGEIKRCWKNNYPHRKTGSSEEDPNFQ